MDDKELLSALAKIDYTPSSKDSDERTTPDNLFKLLDDEFQFTLDVCATNANTKCVLFFSKVSERRNGLIQSWKDNICFMNPPYSSISAWLDKAEEELRISNVTTVCILPCDTSTRWFHNYLWNDKYHEPQYGIQLRFPKGRFKFGKYTTSPQFATIIAVFRLHHG